MFVSSSVGRVVSVEVLKFSPLMKQTGMIYLKYVCKYTRTYDKLVYTGARKQRA